MIRSVLQTVRYWRSWTHQSTFFVDEGHHHLLSFFVKIPVVICVDLKHSRLLNESNQFDGGSIILCMSFRSLRTLTEVNL
mmetsp:Transcript_17313/g.37948  ORF Transcript_17313/g.37948 Transcript_17313/m.37948 type:complete len:80 (+) Transcript_17313:2372-2611(+)